MKPTHLAPRAPVNAIDMFGSDEEVSSPDAATSFPSRALDMFGSDEDDIAAGGNQGPSSLHPVHRDPAEPSASHNMDNLPDVDIGTLAGLSIQDTAAVSTMAEAPAAADMFDGMSSDSGSDPARVDDMFSSDEEDACSTAEASGQQVDSAALDMFSEDDASDVDIAAVPSGRFTAADFDDLDDGLFEEPVVEDSD